MKQNKPSKQVDKLDNLSKKLQHSPTKREFEAEYGGGYSRSLIHTFGSFNQAKSILGLEISNRGFGNNGGSPYTRDSVLIMIRNFYELEGRAPRTSDFDGVLLPGTQAIRRLFGGTQKARIAAGLAHYDFWQEPKELIETT